MSWNPAFERQHYTFGFCGCSSSGSGQEPRDELFAAYASALRETFFGLFDMPMREAWAEANEIVEGAGVRWAYLRAIGPDADTYQERLRAGEPAEPPPDRTFCLAIGTC
jgi:Family of unknown function (DUF6345)